MANDKHPCQSCSMPIDSGVYCQYCVTQTGELQAFEERLENMVSLQLRKNTAMGREQAQRAALCFMATMPAWQDHPKLTAAMKALR